MVARLVARLGDPLSEPNGTLTHCFPSAAAVAEADLQGIGLTGARIVSLRALAGAVARGEIVLDRGANRLETSERLLALPGVGPWTAAYIALRALGDPDALPATDLGLRHALERLDGRADPGSITAMAEAWRPWRGYAVLYLWHSLTRAYNAAA
jgi:AraC family transcriptional regulator of adaptative response / DNA-3-methyladenine glycosylase II